MTRGRHRFWTMTLAAALGSMVVGTAARAAAPPPAPGEHAHHAVGAPAAPNTGRITLNAGVDWVDKYIFRGVVQENAGFIAQPYVNLGVSLYKGAEGINDVSLTVGTWNSFHEERTGGSGAWYESDIIVGASVRFLDDWTLSAKHIWYEYPNGSTSPISELCFQLSYNDAGLWKALGVDGLALAPYVLLAIELDNPNAGTVSEGTYLELGVEPAMTFTPLGESYPVTLSVPAAVGLSLDDYYDRPGFSDETFGFARVGLRAAMPLTFIPADYGVWKIKGGVDFFFLGDGAENLGITAGTSNADFQIMAVLGISMDY